MAFKKKTGSKSAAVAAVEIEEPAAMESVTPPPPEPEPPAPRVSAGRVTMLPDGSFEFVLDSGVVLKLSKQQMKGMLAQASRL